ncbi:MAG: hypothetical protein AAF569_01070 [Pseudomonadota bacterium]
MTTPSVQATETLLTTPPKRVGFSDPTGNWHLDRPTMANLATALRDMDYTDLMLVSSTDGYEFIASRPYSVENGHVTSMYFRQRFRDEHDPQNGKTVLIAIDLTRSLDEQAWNPHQEEVQISSLSENPIISDNFKPLQSELLPDTPKDSVERHTLPEILQSERSRAILATMELPVDRMAPQAA